MSQSESELQLTPPPGTTSSTRAIAVYAITDEEWYAGETLEQCVELARRTWGISEDEWTKLFNEPRELTAEDMERIQFHYDEDNPRKTHSFRTELDMRLADPAQTFPQFFAAIDP